MLGSFAPLRSLDTGTAQQRSRQTRNNLTMTQSEPSQGQARNSSLAARTAISLEYASLRYTGHCPLGLYVIPSSTDAFVWDAVLFVHRGYYADSILKFRLTFPGNYPEGPPAVDFVTDVFHPLISSSGSFNLSPSFRPWRPKEHHAFDVIHCVKAAFKKNALDKLTEGDCFNKEAYRYRDVTSSFSALATQSASLSRSESALFDVDHPSPMGNVGSEIVFRTLSSDALRQQSALMGLQQWENDSTKPDVKF